MKMQDEIRIDAPRERVFEALNDPEILKQSIPGCQELGKVSDTELTATVQAKVGPVKAKFKGAVTLSDVNPPESYTISGEGKGGAAGFAKGSAKVSLDADGEGTLLRYEVDAEVGGKLAQIGNRLVEGTSKKLAGEFFETFSGLVSAPSGVEASSEPQQEDPVEPNETLQAQPSPTPGDPPQQMPRWILITGAVLTFIMGLLWWTGQP